MSQQQPPEGEQGRGQGPAQPEGDSGASFGQKLGRVIVGIIMVLFAVFAVVNAQFVDFSWVFGETLVDIDQTGERVSGGVPLIVLLVVTFALGILAGALLTWQSRRSKRRAAQQR